MLDTFSDPETVSSQDPLAAPFNRAFQVPVHFFEWCEQPGNELRLRRFGAAMKGSTKIHANNDVPSVFIYNQIIYCRFDCFPDTGFDWASLKKDSLVVDVGGGIGATAMTFAKAFPHLRFTIQDLARVVGEGVRVCRAHRDTQWFVDFIETYSTGKMNIRRH